MEIEPVIGPSTARRRVRVAITLVLVAAFVVVAGLGGSGFFIANGPAVPKGPELPTTSQLPATSPLPGTPDTPASGSARLAVVGADGALRSMAADGGSVVTYSALAAAFTFPAWSPDGRQLAAIAAGTDGIGIDVFEVPRADGTADAARIVYQSADEVPFYFYWSPDSQALGFLTTELDGIALRRVPADASDLDRIVRQGAPMYWQWVDPTRLFVHSGAAADAFVGEVGLDGASGEPTTARAGLFRAPALSRSGAYLAYAAAAGGGGPDEVVIESRDGTAHHELPVFGTSAFEFDPTGDSLAFIAPASSAAEPSPLPVGPLRIVDPASGEVRTLLGGPVVAFFWSPDGSTIAALRASQPGGTPAVAGGTPAAPGVTQAVAAGTPAAILARAAAPGPGSAARRAAAAGVQLQLSFLDVASGRARAEQTVRLSDVFALQVLPYFDQYALSHRFWSPDSASIVLPLDNDRGVSHLTVIAADGSPAQMIAAGVFGAWSP